MNIYKRGNVYWIKYQVGGKVYRQSTRAKNKRVAQALADAITTARRAPTFDEAVAILRIIYAEQPDAGVPIEAAWDTFVRMAAATGRNAVEDRTTSTRKSHWLRFVAWLKKNRATVRTVEGVTSPVAAAFASHLATSGLKAKTRINIIGNLSAIWSALKGASSRIVNPWGDLRPAKTDSVRRAAFTREQEEAVIAAASKIGLGWPAACVIARDTGLRYEDVALLRWSEVDMHGQMFHIEPKKTKRHGIMVHLPMSAAIVGALSAIVHDGEYVLPLHAKWYSVHGTRRGSPIRFREVLDAAGVKGEEYTFHSWRHTAATRLAEAGVGKETRKAILGHTTDAMAEHYDHDQHMAEKRAAVEAVERMRRGEV